MVRRRKPVLLYLYFATAIAISFFAVQCSNPAETSDSNAYLNHHDSVDYVGIETCKSCHEDKHSTFIHTGMGKSFGDATEERSAATFGKQLVRDSQSGLAYRAFWNNHNLFVHEQRTEHLGHAETQRINYIVGSGQHTNSHLIQRGGLMFQAPLTYYVQDSTWDLPPGFELFNSRFSRQLDVECISCHNAMPTMDGNSRFKFKSVGQGIDCERCHGPGELHVEYFSKNPKASLDSNQRLIVNPRKLSWNRQIDLCQRCHLQGNIVLQEGKTFTDFKPGMDLKEVFEIYVSKQQSEGEQFDMANHAARFQQSKCFIATNQKENLEKGEVSFSCISCHNPHVSVKQTNVYQFNGTCVSCHSDKGCTESEEVRKVNNNNCSQCHMPQKGAKDIPHVSIHDHKIQIPSTQKSIEKEGNVDLELVCVNNESPSPENIAKAYLTYWEKFDKNEAYLNKASQLIEQEDFVDLQIHLYFLKEQWTQVVDLVESHPHFKTLNYWQLYQVGESYSQLNNHAEALIWLKKSYDIEPYDLNVATKLGVSFIKNKQTHEAKEVLQKVIQFDPFHQKGLSNLGYAFMLEGAYKNALQHLKKAHALYPASIPVLENLSNCYLQMEQYPTTLQYLEKIIELDPNHSTAIAIMTKIKGS